MKFGKIVCDSLDRKIECRILLGVQYYTVYDCCLNVVLRNVTKRILVYETVLVTDTFYGLGNRIGKIYEHSMSESFKYFSMAIFHFNKDK